MMKQAKKQGKCPRWNQHVCQEGTRRRKCEGLVGPGWAGTEPGEVGKDLRAKAGI